MFASAGKKNEDDGCEAKSKIKTCMEILCIDKPDYRTDCDNDHVDEKDGIEEKIIELQFPFTLFKLKTTGQKILKKRWFHRF
jgi:hypothetical protein